MAQGTLLPNHAEVKLLCLRPKDGAIQMEVEGCRARVTCPVCGTPSGRVHSRCARRLGDLPWEGLPGRILLSTRRFFRERYANRILWMAVCRMILTVTMSGCTVRLGT